MGDLSVGDLLGEEGMRIMFRVIFLLTPCLLFMGSVIEGKKELRHPSLTGTATSTLKVLYW